MLRNVSTVFMMILLLACAKKQENLKTTALKRYFDSLYNKGAFEGTIYVEEKGHKLFHSAYGTADRVWNIPADTAYLYDIASVNKSLIAGLIIIAVQEGKLRTEDRLSGIMKGLNFKDSIRFHDSITIHQMLCHTSGLADYGSVSRDLQKDDFLKFKRLRFSNPEYLYFLSDIELHFEPGKGFYYSNFAYHILCILLEELYQKSFNSILQEKICVPLGMKNTISSSINEEIIMGKAEAYNFNKNDSTWYKNSFIDLSLGRRIFSTSHDLAIWAKSLDSDILFSPENRLYIRKNHVKNLFDKIGYGYGWFVYEKEDHFVKGDLEIDSPYLIHGGETEGYKSMLINIEEGKYIISFLSNIGKRCVEMQIAKDLTKIINDEK